MPQIAISIQNQIDLDGQDMETISNHWYIKCNYLLHLGL